ncbi:MAG TPA: GNAT family N-acetyltransferase [Chloroflexota bacterium]|nr:GNAT family N-acetyltransferase [Chloroflexota bacterium]
MDDLTIRLATPGDVPFLRRMQWEAIQASPRLLAALGVETLRALEDQRWAAWPAPDELAFVAEDRGRRRLGMLLLRVHERAAGRVVGYRLAMAVEAEARGRGVGRRLVEHAKRYAAAHGAAYLLLLVDPSNERASRTYRAAGFELGDQHGVVPMIVRFDYPSR